MNERKCPRNTNIIRFHVGHNVIGMDSNSIMMLPICSAIKANEEVFQLKFALCFRRWKNARLGVRAYPSTAEPVNVGCCYCFDAVSLTTKFVGKQ